MKKFLLFFLSVALFSQSVVAAVSFKSNSLLSSGYWVKVKVGETGIYELSYEKLKSFGFSEPSKVKVYGWGGNVSPEGFVAAYADDMVQMPVMHEGDKLYFYGVGVLGEKISRYGQTSGYLYSITEPNPYSSESFYFLTDSEAETPSYVTTVDNSDQILEVEEWKEVGTAFWRHEQELLNPTLSGKNFLGENIKALGGKISFDLNLPSLADEGTFYVYSSVAAYTNGTMKKDITLNGTKLNYNRGNSLSSNYGLDYVVYGNLSLYGYLPVSSAAVTGNHVELGIQCTSAVNLLKCWLDYVTVSYPAYNSFAAGEKSIERFYMLDDWSSSKIAGVRFLGDSPSVRAWQVSDNKAGWDAAYPVVNYTLTSDGDGTSVFVLGKKTDKNWGKFIFFDIAQPQMQPEFSEVVNNQNLHAEQVPDMLIITNKALLEQAERLAEFRRSYDGLDVLVVTQDKVFNEFSSGVRDAMAYRRMCKMLYDRNPEKFKYLLLFGSGTYDNRMMGIGAEADLLLTYQSEESYSEVRSYCSDDFFGILGDNVSSSLVGMQMQIAVGRLPFTSAKNAATYVDKLIAYSTERFDYTSSWKNNMLLIGEDGDDYVHTDNCETFLLNFNQEGNYDMNFTKIYMAAYKQPTDVRAKFVEMLEQGQNFAMFVGHSNPSSMSMSQVLMDFAKATDTKYPHLPIFYVSSCDAGRFDSGNSNLFEKLLENPDGGIIAGITSTRIAYTSLNGVLTNSFGTYLAKPEEYYGGKKTIGLVLRDAKNHSGENSINRMKYHLLGDPSMPVTMPRNQVKVSDLNGVAEGTVTVSGNQNVSFAGVVNDSEGNVDSSFNGYALVTLYDAERDYVKTKISSSSVPSGELVMVKNRGEELNAVKCKISNGKFEGNMVVPSFAASEGDAMPLRVFVADGDGNILSGCNTQLSFTREGSAGNNDTEAPVIEELYLNSSNTFADGGTVEKDFTVYAVVKDNVAVNVSTEGINTSMNLSFDGGKQTMAVYGCYPDEQNVLHVEMPVYDMSAGRHVVELTVTDLSGNVSRKSVGFVVEDSASELGLELQEPAVRDVAVVSLTDGAAGYGDFLVTDSRNNLLFRQPNVSFPYEWHGVDNEGNRLTPGVYNMSAVVDGKTTAVKKIVVLKQ